MHSRGIHGVVVAEVIAGSPADKAGIAPLSRLPDGSIQLGDIITGADGSPVADGNDLFRILDEKNPGEKLTLELTNGAEVRTVSVKLGVLQQ
jgi:S1-C subfamily serine protease